MVNNENNKKVEIEKNDYLKKLNISEELKEKIRTNKVSAFEMSIGGLTKKQLKEDVFNTITKRMRETESDPWEKEKINYKSKMVEEIFEDKNFEVSQDIKKINIIKLGLVDLFPIKERPSFEEIVKRGEELGLKLCAPEVGPYLILENENILKNNAPDLKEKKDHDYEKIFVAMDPIYYCIKKLEGERDSGWVGKDLIEYTKIDEYEKHIFEIAKNEKNEVEYLTTEMTEYFHGTYANIGLYSDEKKIYPIKPEPCKFNKMSKFIFSCESKDLDQSEN